MGIGEIMKKYILSEKELLSLLEESGRMEYYDNAGVDNWGGGDYLFESLVEDGYEDFEDLARTRLEYYTEYKGE